MSYDLSMFSKKFESTEANNSVTSYLDYSARPKSQKKYLITDTIHKLQCVFENPVQNLEIKKNIVDKELLDLKGNLYDLLEQIKLFEFEVITYKESIIKKPDSFPKSLEKNINKTNSHHPFNSKSPNKTTPTNNSIKIVNNKSSLNLGKVSISDNILPPKYDEKKNNLKQNDSKGFIPKKQSPSRNDKINKSNTSNKQHTPVRTNNKKSNFNEQSKRTDKSENRVQNLNESNNINATQENINKTNKSNFNRPSSSVGNKLSNSGKQNRPLKLTTSNVNNKLILNQSQVSLIQENSEDQKDLLKDKLNRSVQTDLVDSENHKSGKLLIISDTSITKKKEKNVGNDNDQQINIKVDQIQNELVNNKDILIKRDKIEHTSEIINLGVQGEDSKRIDIDFHQLGSGKIEDFVIDNVNIESNLLNTVSRKKYFKKRYF